MAAEVDLVDEVGRLAAIEKLAGHHFKSIEEIPSSIAAMTDEMKDAAKKLEFEKAADLRDRIRQLKTLTLGL